jgi:hypothetical protein
MYADPKNKHDVLLSTIYERIFLIQRVPGTLWPIQASVGWYRCLRGHFSKEWLDFVSDIKIKNKENKHILEVSQQRHRYQLKITQTV